MNRTLLLLPFLGLSFISFPLQAQISVFPDLEGTELFDALVDSYKPSATVGNSQSKDILFGEVYRTDGDSVSCVYTGYTVYVDPAGDPSQTAFAQGLNTEHTYPKAMGSDGGLAESDLHHLHPSREEVNGDRGNLPLLDVVDAQADNWYFLDNELFAPPSSNIDLYSERQINVGFEPREDHKGNAARAIFYFFTMYRTEALEANANFFELQRQTLCDWHEADPVDLEEWERTYIIASYQQGKPNPFILDCSLAGRMYCPNQQIACQAVTATEEIPQEAFQGRAVVYPNPTSDLLFLDLELLTIADLQIDVLDARGSWKQGVKIHNVTEGNYRHQVSTTSLSNGWYVLRVKVFQNGQMYQILRPWILNK